MPGPASVQASPHVSTQSQPGSKADPGALAGNGRIVWGVIAAMAVAAIVAYRSAGLSFSWINGCAILVCILIFLGVSAFYRRFRPDPAIAFGAESCAQLTLVLALGCALSYPLATAGFPYCDAALNAADTWLGLDWRSHLRFVNDRPLLATLGGLAYRSILLQLSILFFGLIITSRLLRLQRYVLATALALAATLAVFAFAPAGGTYAFLGIEPDQFSSLSPVTTAQQLALIGALRSGQLTHVSGMEGLITFPSFHAAWAILFMWGFYPIRQLRYGAIVLNLCVLASTPIQGAHYFIDLVGGAVVAAIAIYAATRLTRGSLAGMAAEQRIVSHASGDPGLARSLGGICL